MSKIKIYLLKTPQFVSVFLFFTSVSVSLAAAMDFGPDPHSLDQLRGVIENVFNIFFSVAAGVLLAMIAIGVWKSSMAIGNPQGLEAAKSTWTYALYGFLVIVLFFVLFKIIASFFGISSLTSPGAFLDRIFEAIEALINVPQNTGGGS